MEHPLIGKIDDKTEDELLKTITELNGKITIAMRMGNSSLINQLQMAVTTYRNKLSEKQKKARSGDKDDFEDKIDIS
jgi:putative ribosome biogenesis GTPase RsgA|tara:strand:- start:17 stop:247 length:231 start_codon:yes stop_codon:yes gene_type:complete